MKNLNLQMFAEPIKGKDILYAMRVQEDATKKAAEVLAFQTEGTESISIDSDATQTKDGSIRTSSTAEVEISLTTLHAKGDETVDAFKDAALNGKLVEVWKINTAEPGTAEGKYKAVYYQGYISEYEESATAEDMAEISWTIGVNGTGVKGEATLSKEQIEVAQYVFKDTVKESAGA